MLLRPFEILYDGEMEEGMPALCWKIREGEDPGQSLYGLSNLSARGWQVPAYSLPPNSEDSLI